MSTQEKAYKKLDEFISRENSRIGVVNKICFSHNEKNRFACMMVEFSKELL